MKTFWNNLIDASATSLTAASANADYPVTNLANEFLSPAYVTGTSATAEYITVDLGSSLAFGAIIIAEHNLLDTDDLRFMYSDDSGFSGAIEHQMEWVEGTIVATFPEVEARYVRILFDKSSAGQTRSIGRLFVGPFTDFENVIDYAGYKERKNDLSRTARTLSGQRYSEIRPQYASYSLQCSYLEQEKTGYLRTMSDSVGEHTPFFVQVQETTGGLNDEPLDDVLYVTLADLIDRKVESVDSVLRYGVTLQLEEFI